MRGSDSALPYRPDTARPRLRTGSVIACRSELARDNVSSVDVMVGRANAIASKLTPTEQGSCFNSGGRCNGGKLLGEPKLPQSTCSYFYCVCGLLVFVECPFTRLSSVKPPNRESRANGLLWSLCCDDHPIQPVQALPMGSFCCSQPGCGASPKYNASPKESVSCASAVLFLLCVSRFVLFLLWCFALRVFVVLVLIDIAGPVPTFESPLKPGVVAN